MSEEKQSAAVTLVDRPITKPKHDVSLSAFSYLFAEIVRYCLSNVGPTQDPEKQLADLGYGVGLRMLELLSLREKQAKKERNLKNMLHYIHTTVWKTLFGKQADGLQKGIDKADEYYIYDNDPITNKFISVPKKDVQINCAAFIAGIVNGFLDGANFQATVTAHFVGDKVMGKERTVFIIKFENEVIEREKELGPN